MGHLLKSTVALLLRIVGFLAAVVLVFCLQIVVLLLAWNFVVPDIFGLPELRFWQAACLFVVVRCILPAKFPIIKQNLNATPVIKKRTKKCKTGACNE